MKKNNLNYVIDISIAVALIASAVSGIVLLANPHGSGPAFGGHRGFFGVPEPEFGADIQTWRDIHSIFSIILAAGALGHLILHLKWIKCMSVNIFKRKSKKACRNA